MTGKQFADFAREAASQDVQRAVDAADAAKESAAGAKAEADRAEELRESIEVDYEALHRAVEATDLFIIDRVTGIAHAVIVENGRLAVEEPA